jgi:hypothetical protein
VLFLALATAAVYLQTLGFGYIQLDDPHHIFENRAFLPPSLSHTIRFWIEPFFGMYIPFTYTVWQLTALLSLSPFPFHLLNFVLHLANTFLVFALILFLLERRGKNSQHLFLAFFGALLFCAHPVQAESVAWISGTKDVLFSCCLLAALYCQLRGKRQVSNVLFFLALTSKPTAVIGPAVLLVIDKVFVGRDWGESLRRVLPWFVMVLPFMVVAKFLQADFLVQDLAPAWTRPLVALDSTLFYLGKLLFPLELALDYGRTPHVVMEQGLKNLLLLVPIIFVLIFLLRKKFPGLWGGFCIFLLGFLPVSGIVAFQYQLFSTVADRYLYFSMFGVALAVAFLLQNCGEKWVKGMAAILLCLVVLGFRQVNFWRSDPAVFGRAIAVNPNSFLAHNNLAFYLYGKGKPGEAAVHFAKVVELRPKDALLRMNYAVALIGAGEKAKGVEQLEEAHRQAPENPQILKTLEAAKKY